MRKPVIVGKAFQEQLASQIRWWFDPINDANIAKIIEENKRVRAEKLSQGYILESGGAYYTEQDILDGKTGLNGTLYHLGYRALDNGKWRKATEEELKEAQ